MKYKEEVFMIWMISLFNIAAYKINMFYLKKMNVDMPNLEIFSQRIIKSPIDYIQNKRA